MRIKLTPISNKGKNRIQELGDQWTILKIQDKVLFSSDSGPWLLIEPISNPDKPRWIHQDNDQDFKIVGVK